MGIIEARGLYYAYEGEQGPITALSAVDFTVQQGEFVAILGQNGSGKSTLAKHFNALLTPQRGTLTVAGRDARRKENLWEIRRACGMVFQNPENQFVSTVVAEDVAFGLENYHTPPELVGPLVREALAMVGMSGLEQRAPQLLSGGQQQRVALAGVLAVQPEIIVLDEATAMLDPEGRREVLEAIRRLHREQGKTIVLITHFLEEAVAADRVALMRRGRVLAEGSPRRILTDVGLLASAGLLPPFPVRLYHDLKAAGLRLSACPLTKEELVEQICRLP